MVSVQTDRLLLDPLGPDDLEAFHAYRHLPEVARFQGFAPADLAESARLLARTWSWNKADTWSWMGGRRGVRVAET